MIWNFIVTLLLGTAVTVNVYAFELHLDTAHWAEAKSPHFVVIYALPEQIQTATVILRNAEVEYERILDRIGVNKVNNFWTWDERVKIVLFADHDSFVKATGQPPWSKGMSVSHLTDFKMRLIVSFKGQDDFLDVILPHEISHLVLHDFMNGASVPRWFDEGVAQLDEVNNNDAHRVILAKLVANNKGLSLAMLDAFPSVVNEDPMKAAIFYAESLYIVDFLIKTYGKDKFGELCRQMRDNVSFEVALSKVYYPSIVSLKTLEEKWNQYMLSFVHI